MTLAATLMPTNDRYRHHIQRAVADRSPAEHLGDLLDAIVLDGNVRAMECLACVLVRAGAGMQALANDVLATARRPRRLAIADSLSHRMAQRTARRALSGSITDESRGANRFHMIGERPAWAANATPAAQVGEIVFYRDKP